MKYRRLGNSNLSICEIGFGCMSLGNDTSENNRIIHHAIDSGINYFDTADIYQVGENEIYLGKAVKSLRDKVIIATKVGNVKKKSGEGLDWDPSKKHILESLENSLRRLQTDYIDLYQLHGGTIEDPIDEVIDAFEILKKQGKIRHYGISSIRPNVIREYANRSNIVSVMMQYSLLDRRPEETCFEVLQKGNISVLARGVLAKGLLLNKPTENYLDYSSEEVEKIKNAVASISNNERNPTQTAIRFVLNKQLVASAIIGFRKMEQLDEAISIYPSAELSEKEMLYLGSILNRNNYTLHC